MKELFDFLPAEMEYLGIPGFSYGVMKDGKVLAKGGYGYRNIEQKLPVDEKTLYGIAFCLKSFNSCLIAIASGAVIGGWLAESPYWYSLTGPGAAFIFLGLAVLLVPVGLAFADMAAGFQREVTVCFWRLNDQIYWF